MPSLSELALIRLAVVQLHIKEQQISREDEEERHSAPGYHYGEEDSHIVIDGYAR